MRTLWNFLVTFWNWNEPTADVGCIMDPWGCPKGS